MVVDRDGQPIFITASVNHFAKIDQAKHSNKYPARIHNKKEASGSGCIKKQAYTYFGLPKSSHSKGSLEAKCKLCLRQAISGLEFIFSKVTEVKSYCDGLINKKYLFVFYLATT